MFSKNQMKIKNQMKYNIYKYYLENLVISKKSEKMNEYNEYLKLVLKHLTKGAIAIIMLE